MPTWHLIVLIALGGAQILCAVFASVASADTSRDIFMAQQIASGQWFPMTGPAINAMVHLGPLWYYLLAIPLLIIPNAAAVSGTIGFISATQFPLAYRLGQVLRNRDEGLLFAVALFLPGWAVTSLGSLTHPILAIPSLLLAGLVALAYRERPNAVRACAVGVVLALMCAAHPSLALLGAALLAWCMLQARSKALALGHAALACLVVLLSLAPMLYEQWFVGVSDPASLVSYSEAEWRLPTPWGGIELIYAVVFYGPHYLARYWLGLSPNLAMIPFGIYLLLLGLAMAGLCARLIKDHGARRLILLTAGLLLIQAMFLTAIRDMMPAWMVYSLWIFIAALIALGLAGLLHSARWRALLGLLLFCCAVWTVSTYEWLNRTTVFPDIKPYKGRHGFMDIRSYVDSEAPPLRLPRVPFRELFALGPMLCEPVTLYGHLAQQLEYSSAVSAFHACGTAEHVQFGGPPQSGRASWLGLQRSAWDEIGRQPQQWPIASMGVSPPKSVWHSPNPLSVAEPRYSALPRKIIRSIVTFTIKGSTSPGEAVLVSHRAHRYLAFKVLRALVDGEAIAPAYFDATSAVFLAPHASSKPVSWTIEVAGNADYVDVVTF